MAVRRTLSLSSSLLSKYSIHRNELRIDYIFPFLSHLYAAKPLQFATHFPKFSSTESYSGYSVTYPKPQEIPWKKELCNSVSLIGNVGVPVGLKRLASGKDLAWTRLAVWKSSTETFWINLAFWNELAHVAFQHIQKGNLIYVSGRLVADLVEADDVKQRPYYKVVVQQLNFIDRCYSTAPPNYDQTSNSEMTGAKLGSGGSAVDIMGSTEESWKSFFANPAGWWDNRNNKKNPKYPDFKRKDTGEGLWIEDRYNPPWVKSQLTLLNMKKDSLDEQEATMGVDFCRPVLSGKEMAALYNRSGVFL